MQRNGSDFGQGQLLDELVRPVHALDLHGPRSKSPRSVREDNRSKRRQLKKDEPLSKRGQTQRASISLMKLGSLTLEDLQFLLQQPRNRLMIEESHELQAGTEMGKYMASRGSEQTVFQLPASRAPVGFLRHQSWARAVVVSIFRSWMGHVRKLRQEGVGRRRRRSSSVLIVKDLAASLGKQGISERIDSDTESSGDEEKEVGESIFDPLVVDAAALHTAFRMGSLMTILKAKQQSSQREQSSPSSQREVRDTREKPSEKLPELVTSPSESKSEVPSEPLKGIKRRQAKPLKETLGNSARWDDDYLSPDERLRRERLLNDAEYVGFQMDKLRRTKVVNGLAQTGALDLFEAGSASPGFQKSRSKRLGKEGESVSLPNLARGKPAEPDAAKPAMKRGSSTFFHDKEDKKRGSDISCSYTMAQVRDLKNLVQKSAAELQVPKASAELASEERSKNVRVAN